jgi:hypothetical protein
LKTSKSRLELPWANLSRKSSNLVIVQNKLKREVNKPLCNAVKDAFNQLYIDDIYFRKYLYFQITTNTQYMYVYKKSIESTVRKITGSEFRERKLQGADDICSSLMRRSSSICLFILCQ